MNKLIINSIKIDSVNSQMLPVKKFSEGLNIVCGDNEAGKSTIMKFVKNCFFSPKEMIGDIELTCRREKYQIKIDGKKSKKNERIKIITPQNITVDEFLSRIDRNFFQKAFTIDLDDIKNIDFELFSIIQDFNAPALTKHKNKIEEDLKIYLTDKNRPNTKLKSLVDSIKKIDVEIRTLSNKEFEYSNTVNRIRETDDELKKLKTRIENKLAIETVLELKQELYSIILQQENLKTEFNSRLYEEKQKFYDLSKKTELILENIEELKRIKSSGVKTEIELRISEIMSNYNLSINIDDIPRFDISRDFEEKIRKTGDMRAAQKFKLQSIDKEKNDIICSINNLNKELDELNKSFDKTGINDYETFKEGIEELRSAIKSLGEISDTSENGVNYIRTIIYLVSALFLVALGFLISGTNGIIALLIGVLLALISISHKKAYSSKSSEIYLYIKNDIIPKLKRDKKFIETISALNSILNCEEGRLREYELLKKETDKKTEILRHAACELERLDKNYNDESTKYAELKGELLRLTSVGDKSLSAENFLRLMDDLRQLSELCAKLSAEKNRAIFLEKEIDNYVNTFSNFLKSAGLDTGINLTSLREKINETQTIIDKNDHCYHDIEHAENRKCEIEHKINELSADDLTPDFNLIDLQEKQKILNERRGELNEIKRGLEEFEGLIGLRNEKNLRKNRLHEIIKDIYAWKLALNIINYAEKQQRAVEPNLVSAEKVLTQITGGKYISANYATSSIVSNNGEIKTEEQLSRGTREQLYLAFRLGYALNYGGDGRNYRLPLIIDDAFVNFDKTRLKYVLNTLRDISKTNQVIFFTCHKDYILSITGTSDLNIVDI